MQFYSKEIPDDARPLSSDQMLLVRIRNIKLTRVKHEIKLTAASYSTKHKAVNSVCSVNFIYLFFLFKSRLPNFTESVRQFFVAYDKTVQSKSQYILTLDSS